MLTFCKPQYKFQVPPPSPSLLPASSNHCSHTHSLNHIRDTLYSSCWGHYIYREFNSKCPRSFHCRLTGLCTTKLTLVLGLPRSLARGTCHPRWRPTRSSHSYPKNCARCIASPYPVDLMFHGLFCLSNRVSPGRQGKENLTWSMVFATESLPQWLSPKRVITHCSDNNWMWNSIFDWGE